jgi:DSF synthase
MSILNKQYSQLTTNFVAEGGVLWTRLKPVGVPCVTSELLEDLSNHHKAILGSGGRVLLDGQHHQIRYSILASSSPRVFNLGGQLSLFANLIRDHDRDALMKYAIHCIDVLHQRISNFDLPLITITLLQGDALGGGLEAALSSDIIIAEKGVKLAFPEILFNLFPGMGAYSLVARKTSAKFAERMILDGESYSAEELHAAGLIDVLADVGKGEQAVYEYIRLREHRSNGFVAVQHAARTYNPVTYQELVDITTIWVDAALNLNQRDLRVMDRFVRAQEKLFIHSKAISPSLPTEQEETV